MNRLIEETVFSGLTAACRRARLPTSRSPDLVKATTDGVVRDPSEFGMTTGSPPSMTAMTELVVPRSIPTVLGMCQLFLQAALVARIQMSIDLLPLRNSIKTRFDDRTCVPAPEAPYCLVLT